MEWSRGPTIGRGASATVSLATNSTTGELFAVKSAELSRSNFLQREKHFLSQLSSPYIVQYKGHQITYESSKPIYNLFMEYVPGGTLSDAIKKSGGSIDESTIRIYTHQILQGLNYLHDNNLVHCDIKGQNLLIGKDCVRIADLGCARRVEDEGIPMSAFSGTPAFMAPEVARGEEQGFPADIWALGCTVIEMATGSNPWPEENNPVSALYRIGFSGDMLEIPAYFTSEAKDFLSRCLDRRLKERWTAKQLLQHPFFHDLEMNYPKIDEFNRISPTSVLDEGFWDSVEVPEATRIPTQTGSASNSPLDRIKGLIGFLSSNSNLPNCEAEWITVRINGIEEESVIISEQNSNVFEENRETMHMDSIGDPEEVGSLISVTGDSIPEGPDDGVTVSDCFSVSTELSKHVMDAIISVIFDLERKLIKILFLFNSSVLPVISILFFSFLFFFSTHLKGAESILFEGMGTVIKSPVEMTFF